MAYNTRILLKLWIYHSSHFFWNFYDLLYYDFWHSWDNVSINCRELHVYRATVWLFYEFYYDIHIHSSFFYTCYNYFFMTCYTMIVFMTFWHGYKFSSHFFDVSYYDFWHLEDDVRINGREIQRYSISNTNLPTSDFLFEDFPSESCTLWANHTVSWNTFYLLALFAYYLLSSLAKLRLISNMIKLACSMSWKTLSYRSTFYFWEISSCASPSYGCSLPHTKSSPGVNYGPQINFKPPQACLWKYAVCKQMFSV